MVKKFDHLNDFVYKPVPGDESSFLLGLFLLKKIIIVIAFPFSNSNESVGYKTIGWDPFKYTTLVQYTRENVSVGLKGFFNL